LGGVDRTLPLLSVCHDLAAIKPSDFSLRDRFNEVTDSGIIVLGVFPEELVPGIRVSARGAAPCRKNSQTSF
jgi:hypothetical protein